MAFFRVKPENIELATDMKNIGLRFASSDIFDTCSSSNIFRYHPKEAIQYCTILGHPVACIALCGVKLTIITISGVSSGYGGMGGQSSSPSCSGNMLFSLFFE